MMMIKFHFVKLPETVWFVAVNSEVHIALVGLFDFLLRAHLQCTSPDVHPPQICVLCRRTAFVAWSLLK